VAGGQRRGPAGSLCLVGACMFEPCQPKHGGKAVIDTWPRSVNEANTNPRFCLLPHIAASLFAALYLADCRMHGLLTHTSRDCTAFPEYREGYPSHPSSGAHTGRPAGRLRRSRTQRLRGLLTVYSSRSPEAASQTNAPPAVPPLRTRVVRAPPHARRQRLASRAPQPAPRELKPRRASLPTRLDSCHLMNMNSPASKQCARLKRRTPRAVQSPPPCARARPPRCSPLGDLHDRLRSHHQREPPAAPARAHASPCTHAHARTHATHTYMLTMRQRGRAAAASCVRVCVRTCVRSCGACV
jgi:hypothetical protein